MDALDFLELLVSRPDSLEGRALIAQLDEDLLARYPRDAIHGLRPHEVYAGDLYFIVARLGGVPVGCGALRVLGAGAGEIKRMFVVPEFRGRGIARRILSNLEGEAARRGYRVLRLETGTRQPEALALYRSSGYVDIAAFGEYVGNPFSVCLEKTFEGAAQVFRAP